MKIVNEREWDGGVKGQEITVELPTCDRLVVQVLNESSEGGMARIVGEITVQYDGQGRMEIEVIEGRATFYS